MAEFDCHHCKVVRLPEKYPFTVCDDCWDLLHPDYAERTMPSNLRELAEKEAWRIKALPNMEETEVADIIERVAVQFAREKVRECFEPFRGGPRWYLRSKHEYQLYGSHEEAAVALDRLVAAVVPDPGEAKEGK